MGDGTSTAPTADQPAQSDYASLQLAEQVISDTKLVVGRQEAVWPEDQSGALLGSQKILQCLEIAASVAGELSNVGTSSRERTSELSSTFLESAQVAIRSFPRDLCFVFFRGALPRLSFGIATPGSPRHHTRGDHEAWRAESLREQQLYCKTASKFVHLSQFADEHRQSDARGLRTCSDTL
jgi:hypothetical protein